MVNFFSEGPGLVWLSHHLWLKLLHYTKLPNSWKKGAIITLYLNLIIKARLNASSSPKIPFHGKLSRPLCLSSNWSTAILILCFPLSQEKITELHTGWPHSHLKANVPFTGHIDLLKNIFLYSYRTIYVTLVHDT